MVWVRVYPKIKTSKIHFFCRSWMLWSWFLWSIMVHSHVFPRFEKRKDSVSMHVTVLLKEVSTTNMNATKFTWSTFFELGAGCYNWSTKRSIKNIYQKAKYLDRFDSEHQQQSMNRTLPEKKKTKHNNKLPSSWGASNCRVLRAVSSL